MNERQFHEFPWATALVIVISLIVIVVGGVFVIFDDDYYFGEYSDQLVLLSIGVGLVGIGRGIRSGLVRHKR